MATSQEHVVDLSKISFAELQGRWRAAQTSDTQAVDAYCDALTSHNHERPKVLPRNEENAAMYSLADRLAGAGVPTKAAGILAQEIVGLRTRVEKFDSLIRS